MAGATKCLPAVLSPASPPDLRLPLHTLDTGSRGTANLLGLARRRRGRFVLTSTSEVYGDPLEHPQREGYWGDINRVGPRSVYRRTTRPGGSPTSPSPATRCGAVRPTVTMRGFGGGRRAGDAGADARRRPRPGWSEAEIEAELRRARIPMLQEPSVVADALGFVLTQPVHSLFRNWSSFPTGNPPGREAGTGPVAARWRLSTGIEGMRAEPRAGPPARAVIGACHGGASFAPDTMDHG